MTKRFQMFSSLNVFFDMNLLPSIECACVSSHTVPPMQTESRGLNNGKKF